MRKPYEAIFIPSLCRRLYSTQVVFHYQVERTLILSIFYVLTIPLTLPSPPDMSRPGQWLPFRSVVRGHTAVLYHTQVFRNWNRSEWKQRRSVKSTHSDAEREAD